jgi:hypothetical protein
VRAHRRAERPGDQRQRGQLLGAQGRAYAGTSPITRASGKSRVVLARHARNRRLADALYQWAFSALTCSASARALYDAQPQGGVVRDFASGWPRLNDTGGRLVVAGAMAQAAVQDADEAVGQGA